MLKFEVVDDGKKENKKDPVLFEKNGASSKDLEAENSRTIIKVMGVGGGGCNSINRMIEAVVSGVEFIAVNTDQQALSANHAEHRLLLGRNVTCGRGTGGNPELGRKAAEEDRDLIKKSLENCQMVFLTAGMGGGTGTGAAPVIAQIAKEAGILTVAVVTKPFPFEGSEKMRLAEDGIKRIKEYVDTLIIIPNGKLLETIEKSTPITQAFKIADDVLRQGVEGISTMITQHFMMNLDFADVKTAMENAGEASMGVAVGSGDNRAVDAVTRAIENPLIDLESPEGARYALVCIIGDKSLNMEEWQELMAVVQKKVRKDVRIKIGLKEDNTLEDKVYVTVVLTGFDNKAIRGGALAGSRDYDSDVVNLKDWNDKLRTDEENSGPVDQFLRKRNVQPDYSNVDLFTPSVYRLNPSQDKEN